MCDAVQAVDQARAHRARVDLLLPVHEVGTRVAVVRRAVNPASADGAPGYFFFR